MLVTSLEEVVDNVKRFNKDLNDGTDIVTQLSQFTHWYYIPEIDLFGPSKYIGYKNMNTIKYNRGKGKTGIDTEKDLKEWFIKLSPDFVRGQELMDNLSTILEGLDKQVKSNARIHVLKK